MYMHRYILLLFSLLMLSLSASADHPGKPDGDREAWMKEMQQYKIDYLVKKLDLTDEQKAAFVPLYTRMDNELRAAIDKCWNLTRQVKKKGKAATEADYLAASQAQWDCKAQEARIESSYYSEFKKILTPSQLFSLKPAEQQFMKNVMKKHREHHGKARPPRERRPR